MNELELMLVCSIIVGAFYLGVYLSHKRSIKRIKEKLSQPTIDLDEGLTGDTIPVISVVVNARPFQIPIEKKEDFIPKKRMRARKLEKMGPLTKSGRPDMRYSVNRGDRGNIADGFMEDEEYVGAPFCNDCYDTTDYEFPF